MNSIKHIPQPGVHIGIKSMDGAMLVATHLLDFASAKVKLIGRRLYSSKWN